LWIGPGGTLQFTKNNSSSFPVLQSRVFDLGSGDLPIHIGTQVWPTVNADGGGQMDGQTGAKKLIYAQDGGKATITVIGSFFGYPVNVDS
jgi:hypothetical protein